MLIIFNKFFANLPNVVPKRAIPKLPKTDPYE